MIDALSLRFNIAICENTQSKAYSENHEIICEDIERGFGWIESLQKEMVPLFSPIVLREGAIRKDDNVDLVTAMVLDFDSGEMDLDKIRDALEPNGYYGHTTWSHSEAHPKYRVVVPMDKPVAAKSWKMFWRAFVEERQLPVDKKCCNPSRIYYFPSFRPGVASGEYFSFSANGIPIDTNLYMEMAAKLSMEKPKMQRIVSRMRGPKRNIDWNTFDIKLFLDSNGWAYEEHDGKFWTFCPWRFSHSNPGKDSINDAFFGRMPNGRIMFHCSHAHCEHRWIGSVMSEFDGENFCEQGETNEPK